MGAARERGQGSDERGQNGLCGAIKGRIAQIATIDLRNDRCGVALPKPGIGRVVMQRDERGGQRLGLSSLQHRKPVIHHRMPGQGAQPVQPPRQPRRVSHKIGIDPGQKARARHLFGGKHDPGRLPHRHP